MEELVNGGSPDISYMDNDKRSPLHAAAFVGNCEIVEILIEQVLNGRIGIVCFKLIYVFENRHILTRVAQG